MLDVIIEITKPVYFGAVFACKSVFHFLLIFDFFLFDARPQAEKDNGFSNPWGFGDG